MDKLYLDKIKTISASTAGALEQGVNHYLDKNMYSQTVIEIKYVTMGNLIIAIIHLKTR